MMKARKLPNGNLLVPARAEDKASGVIGDGMVEAKPGTKLYTEWAAFIDTANSASTALRTAAQAQKPRKKGKV
jgi:hypothetical protein